MNSQEILLLGELTEQVDRVLRGDFTPARLSVSAGPEMSRLGELIEKLTATLWEAQNFMFALSRGELDVAPPPRNQLISPFKHLQANLRHLTWQTQQIAAGDLNQQVDFLGEFSVAFNTMIDALREKEKAEERIRYLSIHDPLTGLYNRGYFDEEMARVERGRSFPVSIIAADLDGLKGINDTLGHAVGDRHIKDAAELLRESVRADDVAARVGGDEFVLILPKTDAHTAAGVVARVRERGAEFNRTCREYQVRLSMGIATSETGSPLAATLKIADDRMYQEKFARRQCQKQSGEPADMNRVWRS